MKTFTPRISDHALLRWLERVHGIEMDFFRNQMLREIGPLLEIGTTGFGRDGYWYVADGSGLLVTVRAAASEPRVTATRRGGR